MIIFKKVGSYSYKWPGGSTETYDAIFYEIRFNNSVCEIVVGFTDRVAFGKQRKRVVVFINEYPMVEFAGTDDYDKTGNLVAQIKDANGKYVGLNNVPPEYSDFVIVEHSSQIKGGYRGRAAILVSNHDIKRIIEHALIQQKLRSGKIC